MPANSSLLDLRAGYEFQGDGADVLGCNPFIVHGTGVTFPPGGGVHLNGATGWLETDNQTFGALRDGERLAFVLDFQPDSVAPGGQTIVGRDEEWHVQAALATTFLTVYTPAAAQRFSPTPTINTSRQFLYCDYDGAHVRAKLGSAAIANGDALTGNSRGLISGDANPSRLIIGRLGTDVGSGLQPFAGTIYRFYLWTRFGTTLTPAEIEALRTAPGPLWLPGRRDGLAPIARRTLFSLYRAAPDTSHEAQCWFLRVGPGPERLEVEGAAAFDQLSGSHARLSPDDGVTLAAPFPWPETANTYPGVGGGFYGMSGTIWNPVAGHAVQVWQRQFQHSGDQIYSNHLVVRWSLDGGRTWQPGVELAYDAGTTPFDPNNALAAGYYGKSEASPGPTTNSLMIGADGKLLVPAGNANDPTDASNAARDWKRGAKLCRLTWTGTTYTQAWSNTLSAPFVPFVGDRGMLEPTIAQFPANSAAPNRIVIIWRTETGKAYFTYSDDGGVTLAAFAEWKFADGGLINMASCSPYVFHDAATGKVYFLGDLSFPGVIGGSQNNPRHPLIMAEVDPTTCGPIRNTLTTLLYRGYEHGVLLPEAIQYSNIAFLKRYGAPGYEAAFARGNEDPSEPGKADNYKWRWELTAGLAQAGVEQITFAGAADYFIIKRGELAWNPVTLEWGPLGTGAARLEFCTGLTQGGGNSSGTFLPPAAGPLELVPYAMSGFQPADGDTAGDSTIVDIDAPAAPTGCTAVLVGA